jgi:hypothetical protein
MTKIFVFCAIQLLHIFALINICFGEAEEPKFNIIDCEGSLLDRVQNEDIDSFWNNDSDYIASMVNGELRIVGDIVRLSRDNFPFLARSGGLKGTYLSGIKSLIVDARDVIVDMPIILADSAVRLSGKTVTFTGRGYIEIVEIPSDEKQKVIIIADQLDLSKTGVGDPGAIFRFYTRDWKGISKGIDAWQGYGRRLSVYVNKVHLPQNIDQDVITNYQKRPKRFIRNLTFDKNTRSYFDKESWSKMFDADLYDSGKYEQMRHELMWPQFVLQKIEIAHSVSPYHPKMRLRVLAEIERLKSISYDLSTEIILTIYGIENRVLRGLDPWLKDVNDVPIYTLSVLLKNLKTKQDSLFGKNGALRLWDRIIAANTFGSEFPTEKIKEFLHEIERGQIAKNDLEEKIDFNLTKIDIIGKEIDTLYTRIAQHKKQVIEPKIEAYIREQGDLQKIDDLVSVVKIAAVTVATLYGDPGFTATALGVGTGASVIGKIAEKKRKNIEIDFNSVVKTIEEARVEHESLQKVTSLLSNAWNGGVDPKTKKHTRGFKENSKDLFNHLKTGFNENQDAPKAFLKSTREVEKAFDIVIKQLKSNGVVMDIKSNKFETEDPIYQDHLKNLSTKSSERAKLIVINKKLFTENNRNTENLIVLKQQVNKLSEVQPDEPNRRLTLANIARWHRERALQDLRQNVSDVLRAFSYLHGRSLTLPANQIEFLGPLPPRAFIPQEMDAKSLSELLERETSKIEMHIHSIIQSVNREVEQSISKVSGIRTESFSITKDSSSKSQQRFLERINEELLRQSLNFGGIHKPIQIPIPYSPKVYSKGPVRIIEAMTSDLVLSDKLPDGVEISFRIIHPGTGKIQVGNECVLIRVVNSKAQVIPKESENWVYPKIPESTEKKVAGFKDLTNPILWKFFFPFDSLYFLEVSMRQPELLHKHPPKVKGIRFDFAIWEEI